MKLRRCWSDPNRAYSVSEALSYAFASDNEGGIAEGASRHASELGDKLAELVSMLHETGILHDDQIIKLLSYGFEKVGE